MSHLYNSITIFAIFLNNIAIIATLSLENIIIEDTKMHRHSSFFFLLHLLLLPFTIIIIIMFYKVLVDVVDIALTLAEDQHWRGSLLEAFQQVHNFGLLFDILNLLDHI